MDGYFACLPEHKRRQDDVVMTYTPTNLIQYNEYYAFGLTTANSWTRTGTMGNNFLYNEGSELNSTSQLYDLPYRQYDPVLGRMNGVDPMASKYCSLTPYNYAANDPVYWNDPTGADLIIENGQAVNLRNIITGERGGASNSSESQTQFITGGGSFLATGFLSNPGFTNPETWAMIYNLWSRTSLNGGVEQIFNHGTFVSEIFADAKTKEFSSSAGTIDYNTAMSVVMRGAIEAASRNGGLEHTAFNASASSSQVMQMIYNELGITSNEIFLNSVMLENVDVHEEPGALTYASLSLDAGSAMTATLFALQDVFTPQNIERLAATEKVLGRIAKASGILDAVSHGSDAYRQFQNGGLRNPEFWISSGKTAVDLFMVFGKANPYVIGAWGIYNAYEDLSSLYNTGKNVK